MGHTCCQHQRKRSAVWLLTRGSRHLCCRVVQRQPAHGKLQSLHHPASRLETPFSDLSCCLSLCELFVLPRHDILSGTGAAHLVSIPTCIVCWASKLGVASVQPSLGQVCPRQMCTRVARPAGAQLLLLLTSAVNRAAAMLGVLAHFCKGALPSWPAVHCYMVDTAKTFGPGRHPSSLVLLLSNQEVALQERHRAPGHHVKATQN